MNNIFVRFRYIILCFLLLAQLNFSEVVVYPKIVSLNNDGSNDRLFFKYTNEEGKNIFLKIYDLKGIVILEKKISNTLEEIPDIDGSYKFIIDMSNMYKEIFNPGVYIFVFFLEQSIISKGIFSVVK